MFRQRIRRAVSPSVAIGLAALIAACGGRAPDGTAPQSAPATAPATDTAPQAPDSAAAADTVAPAADTVARVESGAGWGFRAEWPRALAQYPALLAAIEAEIEAARREIEGFAAPEDAPAGNDSEPIEGQDPVPFFVETQMHWSFAVQTPTLVSVVLDGYTYTGGAHGMPLHAARHFDPRSGTLLEPSKLFEGQAGWVALAERIRAELYRRLEEELADLPSDAQASAREGSRQWIDDGTTPGPSHLGLFVPLRGADGRIEALNFIFPPYQVGSYAEGTHAVTIRLADLSAYLSPRWARALGVAPG